MSCWQTVNIIDPLTAQTVHVWRFAMADVACYQASCFAVLSCAEQQRALAYHRGVDKQGYVVVRGILRYLLASYLHQSPDTLQFNTSQQGKPGLIALSSGNTIEFNLSHTTKYAVIAIGIAPLGIDIESTARNIAPLALAKRFFSQAEYKALSALPVAQQHDGFIKAWTTKEAWVKAHGSGIANALKAFDVCVAPSQVPRVIQAADVDQWRCWSVKVAPDYDGALVTDNAVTTVRYYDLLPWFDNQREFDKMPDVRH